MPSAPEGLLESSVAPPPQPTKPFRFKRKRRLSPLLSDPERNPKRHDSISPSDSHHSSHRRRHHHYHHHHHRSRRQPFRAVDDPTPYDDTYLPNNRSAQYAQPDSLDPDTAFRESLFDALADDEGAAFWEGVYGQPIHNYSPYTATKDSFEDNDPENSNLERMTDEEYVSYVRSKMWEKSHQYIFEERRKREEQRKEKKVKEEEGKRWRVGVEEALRRAEERRKRERWRGVWEAYLAKWATTFSTTIRGSMKERISWPVESGNWKDVGKEEVERFFKHAAAAKNAREVDLVDVLKKERVRWHPDKMQQRAGSEGIDEGTMKVVTACFQVVDRLWSERKGR
ncbi:hypothetical protein N7G274_001216 [Stereocaulon virgatum]|uniref:Uncharacterized protein n=1 Tax=Stereocaulon virgatum TaxID=373712 RepID=A0ABR4AN77_9LECA